MTVIYLELSIAAPRERVFDLSRSVDLHLVSSEATDARAVGGVTSGLLELGDEVTWEATHFWVRQRLTSRITAFDRPSYFRDSMVAGAFRRFDHDHRFEAAGGGTLLRERFDFDAPCGPLGSVASLVVLRRYMRRFLEARARVIREVAESDRWRELLSG